MTTICNKANDYSKQVN
uniref:Uncharacterized protein n=1 Tax=Anguilla anguilla TaxID=7936 RepID=A0A0E9VJP0_ANGAN